MRTAVGGDQRTPVGDDAQRTPVGDDAQRTPVADRPGGDGPSADGDDD